MDFNLQAFKNEIEKFDSITLDKVRIILKKNFH